MHPAKGRGCSIMDKNGTHYLSACCRLVLLWAAIFLTCWSSSTADLASPPKDSLEQLILMKGVKPKSPDAYLCTAYEVSEDEAYIYKFEALANASTAHHMLMYGCDGEAFSDSDFWPCPSMCKSSPQTIMFAWAKNAPPFVMPKGVGLRVGKKTTIKTIVLQVHYAKSFKADEPEDHSGIKIYKTEQKPKYLAGILLMASGGFTVPPHNPSYPVDISCPFLQGTSIFPFAYRTHAHGLGKVITGYMYNDTYHLIGKGNPQWPQAFYPVKDVIEVKPGDFLAARCTYDSSERDRITSVGATGNDEMCNFYIMYYTDSSNRESSLSCYGNRLPQLTGNNFPADVSVPLPPNPALEEEAKGHHHHHHGGGGMTKAEESAQPATAKPTQPPRDEISSNLGSEKNIEESMGNFEVSSKDAMKTKSENDLEDLLKQSLVAEKVNKHKLKELSVSDEEMPQYELYDFDDIHDPYFTEDKRRNNEYYTNYAANDLRANGIFGTRDSDEGLSRNRNKQFDAMNHLVANSVSGPRPVQHQSHQQGPIQPARQPLQQQNGPVNLDRAPGPPASQPRPPPNQGGPPPSGSNPVAVPGAQQANMRHIHFEHSLLFNSSWPNQVVDIGQVGGVAVDKQGNVYIFHRGSRVWDYRSFDLSDNFLYKDAPIVEDVVVIMDKYGNLIRKFGAGQYFMPHGITVDQENNIWLTDVALHQVFKIPANASKPSLTLGHRFQHSDDLSYFCKPTDVAVLSTGEFYVSDGYCNSRILKFSKDGQVIKSWGKRNLLAAQPPPTAFSVPHSLALAEDQKLICVADREHGRIPCFDLDGAFKHMILHPAFGPRLFAVEYCPLHGGILYAVNGPSFHGAVDLSVEGFTLDILTGALLETWNIPQSLKNPHDVTVDPDSHSVYVGELDPNAVWKLTRVNMMPTAADHHHDHDNAVDDKEAVMNVKKNKIDEVSAHEVSTAGKSHNDSNLASEAVAKREDDISDVTPSIVIGVLLVIPVVLLLVITLLVRAHQAGKLKCYGGRSKRVFNLQGLLGNSHKGFDPLSTEESDRDDPDDSDREEYTAPRKGKA